MTSEAETLRAAIRVIRATLRAGGPINVVAAIVFCDEALATPRDVPVEVAYTGLEVRGG